MAKTDIRSSSVCDTATLYYIKDTKYKTNYTNVYFSMPLNERTATMASLLAKILKRGNAVHPTMGELNAALTMNYSTGIVFSSFKQGEKTVFGLLLNTMKNEYAPNGEDVFADGLAILFNSLLKPLADNGEFNAEYFESEKRNLRDSILSQINNKRAYSKIRFTELMHSGEAYAVNGEGDLDTLEKITARELYSFFEEMLKTAVCDIYFVGSESEERVKSLLSQGFCRLDRSVGERPRTQVSAVKEKKDVTERLDITQAHLWIGYRAPVTYSDEASRRLVLFNMILGGDITSKMFLNIREKLSLCYSCYSIYDGIKGTVSAYIGIAPENKEKTMNAFFAELESIKRGEISEKELADAKKAYINRMLEVQDNPSLLPSWYHLRLESGRELDPFTEAEKISELTVEDVIAAAESIELDTVYFLTSNQK